jgi:phenylpropionate dioxygenase-like ring-hydroxylating dioxygenase large terminal subunit
MNLALTRLFARLLAGMDDAESPEWDDRESRLDPRVYSDSVVLAKEKAGIFRKMPLCLGHADQLREPGSLLARDLLGLPLLLTRDHHGQIHVLLNVCRHRGARLIHAQNERCQSSGISCPYHAWTYGLDGQLRAVPKAGAFPTLDKLSHGLRRLPSTVHRGLIWTILDPAAEQIDITAHLGDLDDDLRTLDLESHFFFKQRVQTRACNWKLMMDAFQETYHIKRLHASTIAPFFTGVNPAGEPVGFHARILVGRDRLPEALALPQSAWDLRRHATLTHVIFPNSLLIYHPDSTSHMAMFPTAPDQITFVHTLFTPEEAITEKQVAHWDRNFAMIDGGVFSAEDLFISEEIQSGVSSGANETLVFGRQEHLLRRFHENVAACLAAGLVAD